MCVCVGVYLSVCICVFVCVFVHVPCKRKPYMTQLSEPKRLCNYESFYASVWTCACVCVCVHWSWNLQRSEKVATLAKLLVCVCIVVVASAAAAAGHADCRQPRERHQLRASWSRVQIHMQPHTHIGVRALERSALSRIVDRPQKLCQQHKIQLERKSNAKILEEKCWTKREQLQSMKRRQIPILFLCSLAKVNNKTGSTIKREEIT